MDSASVNSGSSPVKLRAVLQHNRGRNHCMLWQKQKQIGN